MSNDFFQALSLVLGFYICCTRATALSVRPHLTMKESLINNRQTQLIRGRFCHGDDHDWRSDSLELTDCAIEYATDVVRA